MRIYLDNCVIQDLKRTDNKELLNSILLDKRNNIYCYSEAHLQDLMRDKSDNKFLDLEFMETIVDANCWHYNKKILFDHIKPKDYYQPFPEYSERLFEPDKLFSEDIFLSGLKVIFKRIPMNFGSLIPLDSLPDYIPVQLKHLLQKPTNFYEFFCAVGDFNNELLSEQKNFRALVSYLHKNNLSASIFEQIGIEGYDGKEITNKEKFRESYAKYFLTDKKGKYRYDLFLDQYNGLEFFSLVKGKPRKQKMMNLINDGRHAFFGAFCDVIVSKDVDFLTKTKFIYEMHDIETNVMDVQEFEALLKRNKDENQLELPDMIKESSELDEGNMLSMENDVYTYKLNHTYYSYFNVVNYVLTDTGNYRYYTKYLQNMSTGTLKNEFEYLTDKLIGLLGADFNGNSSFDMQEIENDNWKGRVWRIENTIIELNFKGKIYLALYPIDYLKNTKTQQGI